MKAEVNTLGMKRTQPRLCNTTQRVLGNTLKFIFQKSEKPNKRNKFLYTMTYKTKSKMTK